MSITVLGRRRARPGQGAALVAAAVRLIEEHPSQHHPARSLRLFQGVDDPDVMLRLSEWDSREAFLARLQVWDDSQHLDALCVGRDERYFFQRVASYEIMSRQAAVVECAIVQCPAATTAAVLTYLQEEAGPVVRALPGFVLRFLYRDQDDPNRLLVLRGRDTPAALADFLADAEPQITAAVREYGATVERFLGYTRAEVEGYLARAAGGRDGWGSPV